MFFAKDLNELFHRSRALWLLIVEINRFTINNTTSRIDLIIRSCLRVNELLIVIRVLVLCEKYETHFRKLQSQMIIEYGMLNDAIIECQLTLTHPL